MGSVISRFISKITRTKTEDDDDEAEIDFLKVSRNLLLQNSIQLLTGACFNCAVFVVVGMALKSIAGPAMIVSIILGAVMAMLNCFSLSELCTRFPRSTSFYSIMYRNVGELCAFMVGWFRLLQSIFMISVVSVTAGEYIQYLAEPALGNSWFPSHFSWAEIKPQTMVFTIAFLAVLSLVTAAGLPYSSTYVRALFWTNVAVFLFMLVVIIYYAGSLNWYLPIKFQPFDFPGTIQGTAITTFFFTNLDKVVEQAVKMKRPSNMVPISLAISILIVFLYYLCTTLFITILVPVGVLNNTATIPEAFVLTTFHSSKYILSSAGIVILCLTLTESYFGAQKPLNLLAQDGFVHQNFANKPNPKKQVPGLSVLVIVIFSIPLFIWLASKNLVQGFCIASLLISIVINCATIVVQYRPGTQEEEKTSSFPKWSSVKNVIIRFILCFGYITHKGVLSTFGISEQDEPSQETSQLVNWSIVSYIPSCIGLSSAMFHGLPVIGWKRWVVLGALGFLTITLFLTIRIILIQPRIKAHFFERDFLASFIPLVNIGIFSVLLVAMDWIAFIAIGAWLCLGLTIYFLFGISHSGEELFIWSHELNKRLEGGVQFDSAPQLQTNLISIQPQNTDADSEQFLFSEDTNPVHLSQE